MSDTNSKHDNYSISLVIPAFNEEALLEDFVLEVIDIISDRKEKYEIILIDDGSIDKTGVIMNHIAQKYPEIRALHNTRNLGLGASYKRGISEAKYEYLMMLCGDGGMPSESLPDIFDAIGTADIVIPYMSNLKQIKTPFRYRLSTTYTFLLNKIFSQNIYYYNGLPVHKTELLKELNITSTGFGFQGEVLTKLLKSGCSYTNVCVKGAEKTNRSNALNLKNLLSIIVTFSNLVWELFVYKPEIKITSDTNKIKEDV